jgi:hypothetical protein
MARIEPLATKEISYVKMLLDAMQEYRSITNMKATLVVQLSHLRLHAVVSYIQVEKILENEWLLSMHIQFPVPIVHYVQLFSEK